VVVCAGLLPLSRASGQFLLLPLAYLVWRRRDALSVMAVGALLLGVVAYYGFMWASTGNAFEGVQAQKHWIQNNGLSGKLWLRPWESLAVLPNITTWHNYIGSALDRGWFLLSLLVLWPIWKRSREAFWWMVALAILPALFNSFVSLTRFIGMAWPLFAYGGVWLAKDRSWRGDVVLVVCLGLHLWLAWRQVNFVWAG
jgi:hypothetical protein